MKKIAIAAAVAMLIAGAAQAQSVGDNSYIDDFYVEDAFNTGSVVDNDVSEGIAGINNAYIGENSSNIFQFNVSFDSVAAGIMATAMNTGVINGSINLDGANITISAQDVEANAMAKADAVTTSTANATSNAFSGNTFTTTAIGALLSASIEVDSSMITDTMTFDSTDLKFQGEDLSLETATLSGVGHGAHLEAYDLGGDAQFAGNIASTESRVGSISAALVAMNTAAIDASVNMTAVYQAGNVFHAPSGGMVDLTNINLTTTALGVINSGSIRLGSLQTAE